MREKIKKILNLNNAILAGAILLAASWAVGSISTMNRNYELQRKVDQAKLDNQITELKNQNLKLEQTYFQTDEFLELRARALLGRANSGEHLVILPQNSALANENSAESSSAQNSANSESNFGQWMDFLFGKK